MPDQLLIDKLLKKCRKDYHLGDFVIVRPTDQWMKLNPTTVMGGCSGLYYSLMFQFPKWYYWLHKVDEWMEVSPEYAETYNLTIAQKQKLEVAIKGGLQSAAQAVADYELLKHDYRKYREILDYWKMGKKDDHVLRSLFVDRVDAFTGEGYSLVTMARRWPTIITDFIRMKEVWTDIEKIKDELQVSQAEATVLKTKNELYKEWKTLFFPDVKDRFARIKNLMQSRKKSVDEYRNWLKPYIARYKLMKEKTEAKPSNYLGNVYMVPGFGQASATTGVRLFAWQGFVPGEMHKPERSNLIQRYENLSKSLCSHHLTLNFSSAPLPQLYCSSCMSESEALKAVFISSYAFSYIFCGFGPTNLRVTLPGLSSKHVSCINSFVLANTGI